MRRAAFLAAALRDLAEIRRYVIRESQSIRVAQGFTTALRAHCERLAGLPGTLGTSRENLGPGLRTLPWRDYVILVRYLDDRVQIVRTLHGARDLPKAIHHDPEG
jgi:plasmid stabilization system protein ParE